MSSNSNQTQQTTAVFPASFDPLTNGHIDVANRALAMFGRLVIAVAYNVAKEGTFTRDERVGMLESVYGNEPRVEVTTFDTLTVDYAQSVGADVIIRGIRAMSDFEYEFEMALMNKRLAPKLETVFLMSSQRYLFVSSSRLKELVRFGRDVSEFVPAFVAKRLREKLVKD